MRFFSREAIPLKPGFVNECLPNYLYLQDAESLYFVLTYAKCGDFFTFLRKTIKKVSRISLLLNVENLMVSIFCRLMKRLFKILE